MVMGIGLKSVWISLRATNYSDRAFRAALSNVKTLTAAEKKHREEMLQLRDVMRFNIATGTLWAANLSIVAQGIFSLMSQTESGAEYMENFNATINEAKVALADTFFETLKPVLDIVKGFLEIIKQNAPLRVFVLVVTLMAMAAIALYSAITILTGIQAFLIVQMDVANKRRLLGIAIKYKDIIATKLLTFAWNKLATAIGIASGGFAIFMLLGEVLGTHAGAIVAAIVAITLAVLALAIAFNVLSLGMLTPAQLGAFAVGAGLAAGVMAIQAGAGFQMGTRGLPATGLFFGHKGEVVYNPATDRPTGVVERETGPTTTVQDIDVTIENVNTRADFDDFDEKMARKLRDLARRA